MVGPEFWELLNNGVPSDDCFDNILNILDFPMESLEEDGLGGNLDDKFQCLGSIPSKVLMGLPPVSKGDISDATSVKPLCSSVPSKGTSQLKHLTDFVEETSGTAIPLLGKELGVLQAPSPNSVLDNCNSGFVEKSRSVSSDAVIPSRTRTRRPRSSTFSSWFVTSSISSAASASKNNVNPRKSKRKKKKLSQLSGDMKEDSFQLSKKKLIETSGAMDIKGSSMRQPGTIKKCTHCEVTKTPQWREGPMGPKTLCNACGVRYRSGRLFPEYRPAASPTFVPSLHSNSHRKVMEMRKQALQEEAMAETDSAMSPPPEFVPMSSYLFD